MVSIFVMILMSDEYSFADQIKWIVIKAIYSHDRLMSYLVLKGGNAIALVHQLNMRTSVDVDFSLSGDYEGGDVQLQRDLLQTLAREFNAHGYIVFDFTFHVKPKKMSADIAHFWGGYGVNFKIITQNRHRYFSKIHSDMTLLNTLRNNAISVNNSKKIEIDISKAEITHARIAEEVDGLTIYAYSHEMIICEKLRAICQQMPDYGAIVHREKRPGASRARDFFDIYTLCHHPHIQLSLSSPDNIRLLKDIFEIKKVPLSLLDQIACFRDFHRRSFRSVMGAVDVVSVVQLKTFDEYFDFVLALYDEIIKPYLK